MIKYSEIQKEDILKIVGAGAPGYAKNGELVLVKEVTLNSVTVQNKNGETANFIQDCGAARLEQTEFKNEFPNKKEEWIVELTECNYEIWGSDIDCGSREEAIEKGMEAAKKDGLKSFRIGRQEYCGMAHIDVDAIIEDAQEQLYNEVGETSETYLEDVTKEQEKELEEALNKVFYDWHKKHNLFPSCYKVLNDEVIEVK